MNKTAFYISIALTAFIVITFAGVGLSMRNQVQPVTAELVGSVPVSDPALPKEIKEREAKYQELIDQANQRLDALQKENQSLQQQLRTFVSQAQQPSEAIEITPDQAVQVAINFLGDRGVYSIEGTLVRGVPLYKVTFSSGAVVYVGLDGQVVGSQAPIMAANTQNEAARRVSASEHEDHEEHEGGSD